MSNQLKTLIANKIGMDSPDYFRIIDANGKGLYLLAPTEEVDLSLYHLVNGTVVYINEVPEVEIMIPGESLAHYLVTDDALMSDQHLQELDQAQFLHFEDPLNPAEEIFLPLDQIKIYPGDESIPVKLFQFQGDIYAVTKETLTFSGEVDLTLAPATGYRTVYYRDPEEVMVSHLELPFQEKTERETLTLAEADHYLWFGNNKAEEPYPSDLRLFPGEYLLIEFNQYQYRLESRAYQYRRQIRDEIPLALLDYRFFLLTNYLETPIQSYGDEWDQFFFQHFPSMVQGDYSQRDIRLANIWQVFEFVLPPSQREYILPIEKYWQMVRDTQVKLYRYFAEGLTRGLSSRANRIMEAARERTEAELENHLVYEDLFWENLSRLVEREEGGSLYHLYKEYHGDV